MRIFRVLIIIFTLLPLALQAEPFPQIPYRAGTIYPASVANRNAALIAFYKKWKAVYLIEGCGKSRAYVGVNADGKQVYGGSAPQTITVSEAHGYGMLALVMMSAVDPDAHRQFDAMIRYFHDHPAKSSKGLLAWDQIKDCSNAGGDTGGENSATDGDLDMGYALLLAHKKWGSKGTYNYLAEAKLVMDAVLAQETSGSVLLIGDWAKTDETYRNTTRTSDFMMSHFQVFAKASGNAKWQKLRKTAYSALATVAAAQKVKTGLTPDFIVNMHGTPRPAAAQFLEGAGDGFHSWNAVRTPWRLTLDRLLYNASEPAATLVPLNKFIQKATGGNPNRVADTYRLNGTTLPDKGPGGMSFESMFAVAAMTDPTAGPWLNALWKDMLATPIKDEDYYGNTLKLMAMITLAGHWDKP